MGYKGSKKNLINTILVYIALFCVSSFALLEHMSINIPVISQLKSPLLVAGTACLLLQIGFYLPKLFTRKYFGTFACLAVFFALMLVSMAANTAPVLGISPVRNTLRLILYLIDLFVLMVTAAERKMGERVIRFLLGYALILTAINDFLMLTRLITFVNGQFEGFVLGTKFDVVYMHMYVLVLWLMSNRRDVLAYRFVSPGVLLILAYTAAVCIRVDCMTGLLGCVVLVVLLALLQYPRSRRLLRLSSPKVLLAALAVSVVFVFVVEHVMRIPLVTYLVENVLGRSTTLTGRTNIYAAYAGHMQGHWLTGYGYGNANVVSVTLFGYENVQNSLLQWVLQIGVPATAAMVLVILQVFSRISPKRKRRGRPQILALIALIYTLICMGTIEIPFNMAFFMWIALIFLLVNERQPLQDERPATKEGKELKV